MLCVSPFPVTTFSCVVDNAIAPVEDAERGIRRFEVSRKFTVPVATRLPVLVVADTKKPPCTDNVAPGVVVPMPTDPPDVARFALEVVEAVFPVSPALNVCNAVHVLALAKLMDASTAPVVGLIVSDAPLADTEDTASELVATHAGMPEDSAST